MNTSKHVKFVLALLGLLGAICLAGCETTAGAGRDMQKLGDNIEDSAERNR